jgi:hypothetical protein
MIEQGSNETNESYIERCWFITKNIDKHNIDKLIILSKIWANIRNLDCTYDEKIMKQINELNDLY